MTGCCDRTAGELIISTHTLTWSVTMTVKRYEDNDTDFNSHAHVERDRIISGVYADIRNFNSHAHVERDQRICYE